MQVAAHQQIELLICAPKLDICFERNKARPDRQYGPHVVRNHMASLRRNIRRIDKEGFRYVHELGSVEKIDSVEIARERLCIPAIRIGRPEQRGFDEAFAHAESILPAAAPQGRVGRTDS